MCIPSRLDVRRFSPSRSQRRCAKSNADLTISIHPAHVDEEIFDLYSRYQHWKHPGGDMEDDTSEEAFNFVESSWADTQFMCFRNIDGVLVAVAIIDVMPTALSAVYTFYHPDYPQRGLGNYGILSQIEYARNNEKTYVYLGFYIKNSAKMRYKDKFKPLELLVGGSWRDSI
jgi:leucyl-tRNA---protein transferase